MKALRIICNLLLLMVVCFSLSITQLIVFDILAWQSSDVDAIHISTSGETNIAYFDSITFWATDIGENLKQPAKYRIRNWFNADWWKNGMAWADKGLDILLSTTKPVLVPIAQINAVRSYYGMTINDFEDYLLKYYPDETAANDGLYELYTFYPDEGRAFGECFIIGTDRPISEWKDNYESRHSDDSIKSYNVWLVEKGNNQLYNTTWKLNKYNAPAYKTYFNKFIMNAEDINEQRKNGVHVEAKDIHIKPAAVILYYQSYVSLIVGIIFVKKYPINLFSARYVGSKIRNENAK